MVARLLLANTPEKPRKGFSHWCETSRDVPTTLSCTHTVLGLVTQDGGCQAVKYLPAEPQNVSFRLRMNLIISMSEQETRNTLWSSLGQATLDAEGRGYMQN